MLEDGALAHSLQEQESEFKHRFPVILLILHCYRVQIDLTALYHVSRAVLQHQHPEEPGGAERCSFGAEAAGGRGTASQSPLGPAAAVSIVRNMTKPQTFRVFRLLCGNRCVDSLCCVTSFVSILWGVRKTTGKMLSSPRMLLLRHPCWAEQSFCFFFFKLQLTELNIVDVKVCCVSGRKRTADMQRGSSRSSRGVRRRPGGERKRIRCVSLKHEKQIKLYRFLDFLK